MTKTAISHKDSILEKEFNNSFYYKFLKQFFPLLLGVLILGIAVFNQPLKAQSAVDGALEGIVYDDSKAPLPNITVTITNVDTEVVLYAQTDESGRFVKRNLTPGTYRVEVSSPNYLRDEKVQELLATRSNGVVPPFYLKPSAVAAATPAPTPNSSAVALSTPTPNPTPTPSNNSQREGITDEEAGVTLETRRGGAFTRTELTSLPLGGTNFVRSFDELAFIVPGVAPPPQAIGNSVGPGVGPGVGTSGQFSVNGLRSRANNFTVDGSDNNDEDIGVRRQGFFSLVPQPIESVQEFQIITLLAPAQFGRNLGAQVNALSRSGGNAFRGSLYSFFNSSQLNARSPFDFVGENRRIPLQGLLRDGRTPRNVTVFDASGVFRQVFVENTAGEEDSLTFFQGGGALGGPIVPNKMFFFVSAEGQLLNAVKESHFAVPTVEQRGFLGSGAEGINNSTFPTTVTGDFVLGLFPFPNDPSGIYGRNTYTRVLPANARGRIISGRYDYNFELGERRQFLTARYNYTEDRRDLQQVGGAAFSSVRPQTRTDNFSGFLTGEITDNLSNVLRFSWGRTRLRFDELQYTEEYLRPINRSFTNPDDARFLLNGLGLINFTTPSATDVFYGTDPGLSIEALLGPVGQVNISGFSPLGVDVFNFPQKRINDTYQIADTLFLRSGNHNVAFGADTRFSFSDSDLPRNSRLLLSSTGAFRGSGFSGSNAVPNIPRLLSPIDLVAGGALTGISQSLILPGSDSNIKLSSSQLNFFAQDEFKINQNLTFSYGLRYELNTVPKEEDEKIESSFQTALPQSISGLDRFINGRSRIYDLDTNNFAPRIGVAYSPNRTTVLRAGYGIYYDQILGAVVNQSRNVFPTFSTVNFGRALGAAGDFFFSPYNISLCANNAPTCTVGIPLIQPGTLNTLNPALSSQNLVTFFAQNAALFPTPFGATIPEKELDIPFSQQYSVGIEQELFPNNVISVAYVGTTGRSLLRFSTPNLGANNVITVNSVPLTGGQPNTIGITASPQRPVANIGAINQFETTGRSRYNALQIQLRGLLTPFNQKFQYQTSYTYSKATDDVSDVFDLAGASALPQNSRTFAGEYAPANFDVRHRFTYGFIYDLPEFREQSGFARYVLGGWQLSGIGKFNTGQPFTVNTIYDVNQDGNATDRLNGTQFIVETGSRSQPLMLTRRDNDSLLSMLATVGQDGSVSRNSFRAGNVIELDMSLTKRFLITENQNLQVRFDLFNFINRVNYGVPVRFLEFPSFGQAVDTITPGRRLQIALKYVF